MLYPSRNATGISAAIPFSPAIFRDCQPDYPVITAAAAWRTSP
jgi:hypothetical protein